jgi:hypothetical protein
MLFKIIINHEDGTYNPNRFGFGYGLFQMNPQSASGKRQYDIGDVNWPLQIYNAAMLNTSGCKWQYWSSSGHFTDEIPGFGPPPRADGVCISASTIMPLQ